MPISMWPMSSLPIHAAIRPLPDSVQRSMGFSLIILSSSGRCLELRIRPQNAGTVTFTAAVETDIVDPDIAEEAEVPAGLKMCCIDDSGVARRLMTSQFLRYFPGSEAQAFGRSREDVPAFVEAVLSGADVVVLDQNLEWSREEVVLGTDLLQELLAKGFQGLLCMRSANSAEADVKFYRR